MDLAFFGLSTITSERPPPTWTSGVVSASAENGAAFLVDAFLVVAFFVAAFFGAADFALAAGFCLASESSEVVLFDVFRATLCIP